MNTDDFERKLQQQSLRRAPAEWRDEILLAANRAINCDEERGRQAWLALLSRRFISSLWPSPKAWGGLAAVWLVVLGINLSLREPGKPVPHTDIAPSPEVIVQLQQQQRLLAELIGRPPFAAEPRLSPRPRSELRDEIVSV